MSNNYVYSLLLAGFLSLNAQQKDMQAFIPLLGKTWIAEGAWGNGTTFKQEQIFRIALDSNLVITETKGFLDPEQKAFGHRAHGIRKFEPRTGKIKFWEFDIEGNTTEGKVYITDKDIWHSYDYGGTQVTDHWEYLNDHTYNYTVGVYDKGEWEQIFLKTQFLALNNQFEFTIKQVSLFTTDIDNTAKFYEQIFGFRTSGNEHEKFKLLYLDAQTQIKVLKKDSLTSTENIIINLTTPYLNRVISHLKSNNIPYYKSAKKEEYPLDKTEYLERIFIQDPNGQWIEFSNVN